MEMVFKNFLRAINKCPRCVHYILFWVIINCPPEGYQEPLNEIGSLSLAKPGNQIGHLLWT